jgi:AcrR family transcriptional regulator
MSTTPQKTISTRDQIRNAAGTLLDEVGIEGLTTTAVSRRARISTSTLYQYFPDRAAILHATIIQIHELRRKVLLQLIEPIATAKDWREPLTKAILLAYEMRKAQPGARSSRRALQASPELWQLEQETIEELAEAVSKLFRARKPELKPALARRIALVGVSTAINLADLADLAPKRSKEIVDESISLLIAYLEKHLD